MGRAAEGFRHLARAARSGSIDAQYRVGQCYLEGVGVPQATGEAVRWFERAADAGSAEAQFYLALLYVRGISVPKQSGGGAKALFLSDNQSGGSDFATALKWARRAAESGSAEGQALLGYILTSGPDALRDPAEAERWYQRSAEAGCPQGSFGLGVSILRRAQDERTKPRPPTISQRHQRRAFRPRSICWARSPNLAWAYHASCLRPSRSTGKPLIKACASRKGVWA